MKDHRVRFVKGDGLEEASEDTFETDEEEIMKQDLAPTNWEDGKKEETLAFDTTNGLEVRTEFPEGEYPEKEIKSETMWSNTGSKANPDDAEIVKGHGVRFVKGDGSKHLWRTQLR